MDKQDDRQTYGSHVVLWDPDFDAMRAAMAEVEKQIEHHKDAAYVMRDDTLMYPDYRRGGRIE